MTETWKSLKGLVENGDYYEVSDQGNVRRGGNPIKNTLNKVTGYHTVSLGNGKSRISYLVHRLVTIAFIPNPENKEQVNHKDFDKINNTIENLEWVTGVENMKHYHDAKRASRFHIDHNGRQTELTPLAVYDMQAIKFLYMKGATFTEIRQYLETRDKENPKFREALLEWTNESRHIVHEMEVKYKECFNTQEDGE